MKKNIKIITPIFILLLGFMAFKITTKITYKKEVAEHIKTIPQFKYETIKGLTFSNKNLEQNVNVVFIYFNSDCEYCESETQQIGNNKDKFKNVQLIFISLEKPEKIKKFAQTYELLNHDNIHFLYDKQASFATTFDVNALPTILIYNSQKQLIEKIKGQVKIDYLLQKIK